MYNIPTTLLFVRLAVSTEHGESTIGDANCFEMEGKRAAIAVDKNVGTDRVCAGI